MSQEVKLEPKIEVPDHLALAVEEGAMTDLQWYHARIDSRPFSVLISRDNIRHGLNDTPDWRWHISVAGESDVPRWRDFTAIVHKLRPGVMFVVGMPPRSMWMNVNPNVLHVHEMRDENLEAQFKMEGEAAKRMGRDVPN